MGSQEKIPAWIDIAWLPDYGHLMASIFYGLANNNHELGCLDLSVYVNFNKGVLPLEQS